MPGVNRLLPVVRPTAPVLLLCGYYGEHNLGDDALLQVLVSSLPEPQQLLITARDPAPVLALAPSAHTVNRRSLRRCLRAALRADVLVLGGGSLLQDSTSFTSLVYYLLLMTVARLGGGVLLGDLVDASAWAAWPGLGHASGPRQCHGCLHLASV